MKTFESALHQINSGQYLSRQIACDAMKSITEFSDVKALQIQMGMLLFGLSVRGPSLDEILGLTDWLYEVDAGFSKEKLRADNISIVGVSGSGKKGHKTINISTASALVAATAGAYIAKPVSKSTSSLLGSSDVLNRLGVCVDIPNESMLKVLEDTGFGVFSIESSIPLFDKIYSGSFYVPHALSTVLAAITNPIACDSYIHGFSGRNVNVTAEALTELGLNKGAVVSSSDDEVYYIDELSPLSKNWIVPLGIKTITDSFECNAVELFGCNPCTPQDIEQSTCKDDQVNIFLDILKGKCKSTHKETICLNSAIILMQTEVEKDPKKAFQLSLEILNSGRSMDKFEQFHKATNSLDSSKIRNGSLYP